MIHNLTDNQLQVLRWLVKQVKEGKIEESFFARAIMKDYSIYRVKIVGGPEVPDFVDFGALDALAADKVLFKKPSPNAVHSGTYTLREIAYQIVAFDFDNPEPSPITSYIKQIIPLIKARFGLDDFNYELCFELDVDFERYIEDRKHREIELCRYLWRVGRLQELTPALQRFRPDFDDWPPYPGEETAVT